jgi:large subunit ribosomal protein L33
MREKTALQSTESKYRYYTDKDKRATPDKLKKMKYDPIVRKHVEFVEAKMPNPKK